MIALRTPVVSNVAFMVACIVLCATRTTSTTEHAPSKQNEKITVDQSLDPVQQQALNEYEDIDEQATDDAEEDQEELYEPRRINEITVKGNRLVPTDAILNRIPYKKGEIFDPSKTHRLIHNLYYELKRFRNISIYAEKIGSDRINLEIVVEEKKPLKDVIIQGHKQITQKEIRDKLNFAELPAVDAEELKRYALAIQKMYKEKGFHVTDVETELTVDEEGKSTAVFTITEHPKALVKRIKFIGNKALTSKQLKNMIFTREDWILGFMDKAGSYQEDRLEGDKHVIEQYYQNIGYANAKVTNVETVVDKNQNITLVYEIDEGDKYTVSSVSVSGNGILSDDYLLSVIPIKPGDIYSRERLVESIRTLEFIWGDLGYAFAHIDPSIQPDEDNKTVKIEFFSEPGKPVVLNKLTIKGNHKTRDKIIRRKLSLEEGVLITTRQMELSKNRVEALGYFDQRDGVNWKLTRLSDDAADLDLFVKEVKTGSAHLQLGFGGSAASLTSNTTGVTLEGTVSETNLFGSGVKLNLTGKVGTDEKTVLFNLTQPWLFDRPIYGAMDVYHKRVAYDELRLTRPVNEKYSGGLLTLGFVTNPRHQVFNDTFIRLSLGVDNVEYEGGTPKASIRGLTTLAESLEAEAAYNFILSREFMPGAYTTLNFNVGKDLRNHPMHPTRGYSWLGRSIFALAALDSCIGFHKVDVDINWFTPLIGEFDLILRLHGYFGVINTFKNRTVPYRELFHIGGPASVRGFLFGQIGPQFTIFRNGKAVNDSIGGQNTFFINAELIFPVTPDFTIKGVLFYDGGAGWKNPFACCVPQEFITNNAFNYRHAVGFGIRLLNPMPIKVDWGFKLDARKGETPSEVHFGMAYDW